MAKILVVDDETDLQILIKQKFRKQIREKQYEFIFAFNGKEALGQLEEHDDVSVVLSDINMPEMDGLTLLARLKEKFRLLKTVIVSAYGDMENIRTAMNRGAFDFITKPIDFQDLEITLDKTLEHVTTLQDTMTAVRENDILKMYVDETVLNFMKSREFESSLMASETIDATVAFIDICQFTSISEKEPPEKVVNILNNYFEVMVKEIIAQKGYVDKFIGDAVMAVFRDDYQLDRAIDACIAIRKSIDKLPETKGNVSYRPHVAIGINRGKMISGNTGSATLRRLDYTVIGDSVNTAQRLQSMAKEGQILISSDCHDQIKESFDCKKVGDINLKHKTEPMTVYEVVA